MDFSYSIVTENLVVTQGSEYTTCIIREQIGTGAGTALETIGYINLSDTDNTYEGNAGKIPIVTEDEKGLRFGKRVTKFTDLSDALADLSSRPGQILAISDDGKRITSFQYNPSDLNIEKFTQLADTFADYTQKGGKVIVIRNTEDGLETKDITDLMPTVGNKNVVLNNPVITLGSRGQIIKIDQGSAKDFYEKGQILVGNNSINPITISNPSGNDYTLQFDPVTGFPVWKIITGIGGHDGAHILETTYDSSYVAGTSKLVVNRDATGSIILKNVRDDGLESSIILDTTNIYLKNSRIDSNGSIDLAPITTVDIVDKDLDQYNTLAKNNTLMPKYYIDKKVKEGNIVKLQEDIPNDGIVTLERAGVIHRLTIMPTSLDSGLFSTKIVIYDDTTKIVLYSTKDTDAEISINEKFVFECLFTVSEETRLKVKSTNSTTALFSVIAEICSTL